jgi:hypothetical protein
MLPDAKVVKVEVVRSFWNWESYKLFTILIDVCREPTPVSVLEVIKIFEPALPKIIQTKSMLNKVG